MTSPFRHRPPTDSINGEHAQDVELATRASKGQARAQREIFRRLEASVHGTLRRVLGEQEPIDDLVQDAFVEIFRSIHTYGGRSRLITWADRISTRVALRYVRSQVRWRDRRQDGSMPQVGSQQLAPDDTIDHRDGLRQLGTLLAELNPKDRAALALFELDGCSIAEVAHALDITPVAAKTRLSRARKKVRAAARGDRVLARYVAPNAERRAT